MDRFISRFEKKVLKTIRDYGLISKGERIIVLASGGKDSTAVLHILQKFGYEPIALHVNLKIGTWSDKCQENLEKFCSLNGIELKIVDTEKELGHSMCFIRTAIKSKLKIRNCSICGVIRRRVFNRMAKELKADKLATGHNLDDEAQAVVMNFVLGNVDLAGRHGPITGTTKGFVPRIKPLYFCRESDVKKYSELMGFPVDYRPCPCGVDAFRGQIERWLNVFERKNPRTKENIIRNFLTVKPGLERTEKKELGTCKICSEPSSGETCRACGLLELIRPAKFDR